MEDAQILELLSCCLQFNLAPIVSACRTKIGEVAWNEYILKMVGDDIENVSGEGGQCRGIVGRVAVH